jgi:ribosomal protein S18 acetylase RimI-like enzyme
MNRLTELLSSKHKKENFSCVHDSLTNYLIHQAGQDMKRNLSVCFVLPDEDNKVVGYFTLSNDNIPAALLPDTVKKKLPKSYVNLPATLLGRLAVDKRYTRMGKGEELLLEALRFSYEKSIESIGSMAVVVDPIDQVAVSFYSKYGFVYLPGSGKMFLTMKSIRDLFTKYYP